MREYIGTPENRRKQYIETILENARFITGVIENIMMRCIQDQNEKEESIDVHETIKQKMMFYDSHLYFKHQIEKRYNLDPDMEKVRAVHSDLSQIFDALIKNAIEAMYDSP